jgi:hypothetical protein
MNLKPQATIAEQIRDYDICFTEFLRPPDNGQKIMQAILLREAFRRFAQHGAGVREDGPTAILDVSCGPGDYSVAWTSEIAPFLAHGMVFYCADYPSFVVKATGEKYTAATARKIQAAAQDGRLKLAKAPVTIDIDLFSGGDRLMPPGKFVDILHWSHSGYHVRDALGQAKNDPGAIAAGINTALDKMWAALDPSGLMISVHQTRDIADGQPSQMLPVSRKYCGALDSVPELIESRIDELGGFVATVTFASPLRFPGLDEAGWGALRQPAQWDRLDPPQRRALLLLNFIAYDFSNPAKAALETLAENGRLAAYVDEFKSIVTCNAGNLIVKCALQMSSKSTAVATSLDAIARQLRETMPLYRQEMTAKMEA